MPQAEDMHGDGIIRSVTRALRVLAVLNEHEAISLAELHKILGLPKTTIHRLLTTLCHAGYAQAEEQAGAYRVSEKVRELGAGYTRRSLVVDVGVPIVKRVTREIKWPLAIGTLEGTVIVIRYSTMPYSPLAVQATTVGHRHGLLGSASGMAYLAFCDELQRESLLRALVDAAPVHSGLERSIWSQIRSAQQKGYGLRLPSRPGDSATVAVPIKVDTEVAGVLSMTTFGKLMDQRLLVERVPVLNATAAQIGSEMRKRVGQEGAAS
ncbi:helix-turn-helix domain-containing protein [Piscinibacter sp.]|uniref:helix-turn-helix domain-containing protein n=1 Tax=Piscinibacter sp. TaxID=1903157 RepID=UPI0039E2EF98